jgi:hypothetical protein
MWIFAATAFFFGSIRETVPSPRLSTQTVPSATATAVGLGPTGMICVTARSPEPEWVSRICSARPESTSWIG